VPRLVSVARPSAALTAGPAPRRRQFRALADQLYRSEKYHEAVRAAVCAALGAEPDRFAPYVVGEWEPYLASAAVDGTWGDHVTLQARPPHLRCVAHAAERDSLDNAGCC
jgi:hypothetical protein